MLRELWRNSAVEEFYAEGALCWRNSMRGELNRSSMELCDAVPCGAMWRSCGRFMLVRVVMLVELLSVDGGDVR